jgi:hypothetical protein
MLSKIRGRKGTTHMKLHSILFAVLASAPLVACSTASDRTSAGFSDAALAPLNDLNLRRVEIPKLLADIRSPYEPIPNVSCKAIGDMVVELTKILGRDSDAEALPDKSLGDKAGEGAADMTLDAVSSTMTDFIPFRSLVRDATGASRHERRLRAAFERGVARRAYLKGVGAHLGCAPPAAPDPSAGIPKGPDGEFQGTSQAE